jgi:(2S)-methylsuccinyl-CoA dehydrogenase
MTTPDLNLTATAELISQAQRTIDGALDSLAARGGVDANQSFAYDLAHAASAIATARSCLDYAARGSVESSLTAAFTAGAFADLAARVLGREELWGVSSEWFAPFRSFVATYRDPHFLATLADQPGPRHLDEEFAMVGDTFHRFAEQQVRPHAEHIHRTNGDIPESIIEGLAELGGFGLSVPEEYGGFATGGESDYLGMVVATEELTWGGLGIGGSLITRPEILTRALVNGGTEEQKQYWLPRLASAETLAAVAVTEPDFGSDVAGLNTSATRADGGWLINGTKTWCTFGARANVLMLLARTDPDRSKTHRGLSLFLVEKPIGDGHGFLFTQDAAAEVEVTHRDVWRGAQSTPLDTGACTAMSSASTTGSCPTRTSSVAKPASVRACTTRWPDSRTDAFKRRRAPSVSCRPPTKRRSTTRRTGSCLASRSSTTNSRRVKLGTMAAIIQAARQFSLDVAKLMAKGEGTLEASMAKAYVCRAAEWVTREAMQIHGGMGYAEEYPVSRYFVDARVLSIFEGADETLCLKVVARRLLDQRA